MSEEIEGGQRTRKRLWLALAALAVILAGLIVPPLVNVTRYKAQITQLISASLGRPVRMSSVEVRLLPRPGFVLSDFTVEEDPAYGAEPVLRANTVTASIRLLSLWRGRLEIDTVSVDEASLNVVRTADGRWNLDPLLRTATAHAQSTPRDARTHKPFRLPSLEATNSRINVKDGVEKLPFSLANAEMSMWQQSSGNWRVRLRGQPVRTDISLEQSDTGMVRLEATLHPAPELRQMPVRLSMEWSQAQLGALTRLILGNDAGWRGDLTGDLQLDGTAEAAKITARLRAIGVHRAEFEPAEPMDFDANCSLVAHFSARATDNLTCDSPLGDGHVHLAGTLPGNRSGQDGQPRLSVQLDRISVAVALDALRSMRSGLAPGLEASGSASGEIDYAPGQTAPQKPSPFSRTVFPRPHAMAHPAAQEALTGSIVVDGFKLSGDGMNEPILIPRLLLTPATAPAGQPEGAPLPLALAATVAVPAGAPVPLTISTRLALSGYEVTLRGQASIARARELSRATGISDSALLDSLAGEPLSVNLTAQGPWMPAQALPFNAASLSGPQAGTELSQPSEAAATDSLTGTVILRNVNWKADYLANHVLISQATLHLDGGDLRWDPVDFAYGPVKGSGVLTLPTDCIEAQNCTPVFQLQFGALDAAVLQAAFLGAHERTTLLSSLLDRFRSSAPPAWPQLAGTVKAESLRLGPVTLDQPTAGLAITANGAQITAFDAGLLGGRIHGTAALHAAATAQDKPSYEFEGQFQKLRPAALGQLLRLRCSGGSIDGNGKVELAGFTSGDLAASAKGALHFEWRRGSVAASGPVPPALARFDSWTADATIANGALTLQENQLKCGGHTQAVQATAPFAEPLKVDFATPKISPEKR